MFFLVPRLCLGMPESEALPRRNREAEPLPRRNREAEPPDLRS
jgi:hypothetical protein